MSDLLTTENLVKQYKDNRNNEPALKGINLTLESGRIVGLLGPNGSGKTTLIKLINGLLTPTEGQILINGMAPCADTKAIVSYLPERMCLPLGHRVRDIVEFYSDFYEDFDINKAYEMLASLGISSDSVIKKLSKGTKEKVSLIMVMSRKAKLYVLDEPIAGVDPAARDYILRTILGNYSEDATILMSTHLISDVENILDDVIFIKEGNILLTTSVEKLREEKGESLDSYFREVFAC